MRLYVSTWSPYARVVRMAIEELGFGPRVEVVNARTRTSECEVNEHVPTGKVPMLSSDDGFHFTGSRLIVQYLDALHTGEPLVDHDPAEADRAFEGAITGFLDGVAAWSRELLRPHSERSPALLEQERARAARCLPWLDARVDELGSRVDYPRLCLAAALFALEARVGLADWREQAPRLAEWYQRFSRRPSFQATLPRE